MARWLSETGGLRYHLRARKYRGGIWAPFIAGVGRWLDAWRPPETEILLVGPSAGHCLPGAWLSGFRTITAVDPDPIARWLFQRRFGGTISSVGGTLTWDVRDYFGPGKHGFEIATLTPLLETHPRAAVLFCNFLGQMALLDEGGGGEAFERWKQALPAALTGRSYASFHDRISGALQPELDADSTADDSESSEALVERFYARGAERAARDGREVELIDHRTGGLFPGRTREYAAWELYPGHWHLVEWVSVP